MDFDRNQREFVSPEQREVWEQGTHIVPLAVSLADITDEQTRQGCTQIYQCIMEILTDMYAHTEDYRERPRWYTGDYLVWLTNGEEPMKKHAEEYNRYLQRIWQFGFICDAETGMWSNEKYPLFFEYFPRMAQLFRERKKNLGGYLARLDFRLFAPKIHLSLDDFLYPLSDDAREMCLELHNFALSQGFRVEKKNPYVFRYLHNKLYSMEISNNPFSVSVQYRLDNGMGAYKNIYGQLDCFLKIVQEQADCQDIEEYILRGIMVCNACGGQKRAEQRCGVWIELFGKRFLVSCCHIAIGRDRRIRSSPYTAYDISMMKRLLAVRREQIDRYSDSF